MVLLLLFDVCPHDVQHRWANAERSVALLPFECQPLFSQPAGRTGFEFLHNLSEAGARGKAHEDRARGFVVPPSPENSSLASPMPPKYAMSLCNSIGIRLGDPSCDHVVLGRSGVGHFLVPESRLSATSLAICHKSAFGQPRESNGPPEGDSSVRVTSCFDSLAYFASTHHLLSFCRGRQDPGTDQNR